MTDWGRLAAWTWLTGIVLVAAVAAVLGTPAPQVYWVGQG